LMAFRAFIRAALPYVEICSKIQSSLRREIPQGAKGSDPATQLGNAIQDGTISRDRVLQVVADCCPRMSEDGKRKFYNVISDGEKRFFNKTPFKDGALASKVCELANIELAKANVSEFIDFIANSSIDLRTETVVDTSSRNILIYGAPGTGKSYLAERMFACATEHLHRVVFFSEYQNADFVGTLRPAVDGETVTYRFVPGPLVNAWVDALQNPDRSVVLLIDELNRGNAPSIFGEAFQLLDRDEMGSSQYEITLPEEVARHISEKTCKTPNGEVLKKKYGFPQNLFIIGTMNSADQGVFPLDTAFKRRWSFRYMPIDFEKHREDAGFNEPYIRIGELEISWKDLAITMNAVLEENQITEDRFLGPYFVSPTELKSDSLSDVVAQKVLPYLWDDVLKLDDERSIIFNTADYKTFTALQSSFLAGGDVFNADVRQRLASRRDDAGPADES